MKTERKNDRPLTFDDAEKMVRAALKGTDYGHERERPIPLRLG